MARLAIAALAAGLAGPVMAADINLLVGFPPGQGSDVESGPDAAAVAGRRLTTEPTYDDAGRFYAERLGLFLPGAPKVTMRLAPGAASLLATQRLLADTTGEGTTLALLGPRAVLEPLVAPANAPWRPDGLAWIGARQRDDDLCVVRADAPVRDFADMRTREIFIGALSPGSRSYIYPRALNDLAGAKLKIISGYGSEFEAARALETGEIHGWCGWSMNGLRARHSDLLRQGRVRPFVQFSMIEAGKGLDIPRASDLPSDPVEREAMRAIESQTRFGAFAIAAAPSTRPERVADLRAGFLAMLRDPETQRLAAARGIEIDPVPGEELQALATSLNATSPAARDRLREVLRGR